MTKHCVPIDQTFHAYTDVSYINTTFFHGSNELCGPILYQYHFQADYSMDLDVGQE